MAAPPVAVVAYECRDSLLACLASLEAAFPGGTEVVVADNASEDGGPDEVERRYPAVQVIRLGANLGFGAAANRAIRATRGDTVLLLNPDVRVPTGGPRRLVDFLQGESRAAVAAPPLVGLDSGLCLSWGRAPGILTEAARKVLEASVRRGSRLALALAGGPVRRPRLVPWASGAALLLRRTPFEAAGGFDEGFFLYYEDIDLCMRLHAAGWETWLVDAPPFVHEGGVSTRRDPERAAEAYRQSQLRYFRRHRGPWTVAAVRCLVGGRLLLASSLARGSPAERQRLRRLGLGVLRGKP